MECKYFKLTSICLMALVFGMKLAAATPIQLIFDWTGQCDDCQGPNGAIDVPGTNWNDGYTQTVSGKLIMSYDAQLADAQQALRYVSFNYHGSSILRASAPVVDISANIVYDFHIFDGKIVLPRFDVNGMSLSYKGDYVDFDSEGKVTYDGLGEFESRTDGSWSIKCKLVGGYPLCGGGPKQTDEGNGGGREGGGSRDAGTQSLFVMRGVLPLDVPAIQSIPEPYTIAIFALGVLGLSLRRNNHT
jgi:hypothetical protein